MLLLSSPLTHSFCLYMFGLISIPINTFGGYCILFQTPGYMKSVKWILFNLHIWSSMSDLFYGFVIQPFNIAPLQYSVLLGLIRYTGLDIEIQVPILLLVLFLVGVSSVAVFENRFYLLCAQYTRWIYIRYFVLAANCIMIIFVFVPFFVDPPEKIDDRKNVFEVLPELRYFDSAEYQLNIIMIDSSKPIAITPLIMFLSLTFEILVLTAAIYYTLTKNLKSISVCTVGMQKILMRAICFQISIPLFIMLIPEVLVAINEVFPFSNQELTNVGHLIIAVHGVSETIVMLYIHKPYRDYCRTLFYTRRVGSVY